MTMEFRDLSEVALPQGSASERPLHVCFVTPELVEFYQNGGIGTATSGLIEALRGAGFKITVFYTGWAPSADEIRLNPRWSAPLDRLEGAGVTVTFLRHVYKDRFAHSLRQISYACYDFVKAGGFDVVHFNDYNGNGYYSCLAKRCGAGLQDTRIVTTVHGTKLWAAEADLEPLASVEQYEQSFLEHQAIANSEYCIGVSAHLLQWLADQGVPLPKKTYLHKNCHPPIAPGPHAGIAPGALKRLVFFGRMDQRKGVDLFITAAKPFLRRHPEIQVGFYGRFSRINGEHAAGYILHRLFDLPNSVQLQNRLDRNAALKALSQPGTLAVMPSRDENSPCVIVECQTAGIPFVATDVGGISELVLAEDREAVLVSANAKALTAKFEAIWRSGQPAIQPNRTAEEIAAVWVGFHQALAVEMKDEPQPVVPGPTTVAVRSPEPAWETEAPLVSVCITHYKRPHLLPALIEAIEAQSYPNIEIVLVDDGSHELATEAMLGRLERRPAGKRPLIVKRIENSYLGAARNAAAASASGEFLKYQDDDNLPLPGEVATLVRAAQATEADAVTCFAYQFTGKPPIRPSIDDITYFPLGGSKVLAYLRNEFGDANALVRHSTFKTMGGFTEDRGVGCEDYEFFARCISRGGSVICVPEPLFFYRVAPDSMLQSGSIQVNALRARRGFAEMPASELKIFADIEFGRQVRDQTNDSAWFRVARYEHGILHQQLLEGDPNTEANEARVADMLGRYGRVEDALRYIVTHGSLAAGIEWVSDQGQVVVSNRNQEGGAFGRPVVLNLAQERSVRMLSPLRHELPTSWEPEWAIVEHRATGLLIHPVDTLTTIACLPYAVDAGATRITVRWTHTNREGSPAEVAIGIGRDEAWHSEWMLLGPEDGPVDLVLELPPQAAPVDLILKSRAPGSSASAWAVAQFARIEFL